MFVSMTGFGRSVKKTPHGDLVVEIYSVNRKVLDVSILLPKELGRFEQDVRSWVGKKVSRGQVTVRLAFTPSAKGEARALPDIALLQELKKSWQEIAQNLGMDASKIDLPFLMLHLPVREPLYFVQEEDCLSLKIGVEEALKDLLSMRQKEGMALAKDILHRLVLMDKEIVLIEKAAPEANGRLQKKLAERLKEVSLSGSEVDERILREIVIYAEKVDVSEEVTRLFSHIDQFRQTLEEQTEEPVGRKLEFLTQEMGREVNTIGAKSSEIEISRGVLRMKSELEKIKEQIQNIE